uniref:Ig-like domain-containing protein n=1 Tax=Knipowitschia caucasica TaxID=637954 RepID=A0AAV2L848_KNICA
MMVQSQSGDVCLALEPTDLPSDALPLDIRSSLKVFGPRLADRKFSTNSAASRPERGRLGLHFFLLMYMGVLRTTPRNFGQALSESVNLYLHLLPSFLLLLRFFIPTLAQVRLEPIGEPVRLEWFSPEGDRIVASRRMALHTESSRSRLIIYNAIIEDAGIYRCQATDASGHTVEASVVLEIYLPKGVGEQTKEGDVFNSYEGWFDKNKM